VIRIGTVAATAQMVEVKPFADRAVNGFISNAVSILGAYFPCFNIESAELTVSELRDVRPPYPAAR